MLRSCPGWLVCWIWLARSASTVLEVLADQVNLNFVAVALASIASQLDIRWCVLVLYKCCTAS